MFKPLFEFVRQALFLQQDVRQLKEEVAGLERGLHETNEALRQLAFKSSASANASSMNGKS